MALNTTKVPYTVPKFHELWFTGGLNLDHFYQRSVNFAFSFVPMLRTWRSMNTTEANFVKQ